MANANLARYSLACKNAANRSNVEFVELYESMMKIAVSEF